MVKKAVDIVLLPGEEMAEIALEANAEMVAKFGSEIVLDKGKCLPHISLAMGCIRDSDISSIGEILEVVAKEGPPGKLVVTGIITSTSQDGKTVSLFKVERTRELQLLHESIMEKVAPYFSYDVTREMIYGEGEVAETTLSWIKNYPQKASYENFQPHITIGYGETGGQQFPIEFNASKLALCHLGNHCTCRKLIQSTSVARR